MVKKDTENMSMHSGKTTSDVDSRGVKHCRMDGKFAQCNETSNSKTSGTSHAKTSGTSDAKKSTSTNKNA